MKTISIEQATLDDCVTGAQRERILITKDGAPVALVVGVEGLDEEQLQLGVSDEFWRLICERRGQKAIGRDELQDRIKAIEGA